MPKIILLAGVAAAAALGVGAAVTIALNGTESTTTLDQHSTETVDGQRALARGLVEGRALSKFHPLPWVGTKITALECPTGLPAAAGATMTCTAAASSRSIPVRVSVVKVDGDRISWKFER